MARLAAVLVGVSLSAAVLSGGAAALPENSPARAGTQAVLVGCPSLERNHRDPVNGRNCVRELQTILYDLGYDQPRTGKFGKITEANVKDFQGRHNLPTIGVVGPKTRKALGREMPSTSRIPEVPRSSFSTGQCTSRQCDIYLSRTTTRKYARMVTDNPGATSGIAAAILGTACKVFKLSVVSLVCQVLGDVHAGRVKAALTTAAQQNACVRVTLKRPDSLRSPLSFGADNSSRCRD